MLHLTSQERNVIGMVAFLLVFGCCIKTWRAWHAGPVTAGQHAKP